MKDIIIVGAGASGLMAAIMAARNGSSVLILEHMDIAGKKILATGNGKCNFTNKEQGIQFYRGTYPAFVLKSFEQFGVTDTVDFFENIGVIAHEKNGYYYPYNDEASTIREALVRECQRLHVEIQYNIGIRKIFYDEKLFHFETKNGDYTSLRCIMATGGKAAKKTGSDGSGFLYLESFKQPCTDIVPALVQLKAKQAFFKKIAGIRAGVLIKLFINNRFFIEEKGELQITDYGISGIPVFQLSRFAAEALKKGQNASATINFLPDYEDGDIKSLLNKLFKNKCCTVNEALTGLLHKKLIPVILELAGITDYISACDLQAEQCLKIKKYITEFPVTIIGTNSFDQAQVSAGGVDTSFVNNETMESKIQNGLYFCGEMLDVDGKCGGYNLQWAWTSGAVAGIHAALSFKQEVKYD